MRRNLEDSVVVITGASSGIGRATALAFAKRGAKVVATARREQALREVVFECESFGAQAIAVGADVRSEEAMRAVAALALQAFGRIDVWVNNAAVSAFGRFEGIPVDTFRQVIETNLFGYVNGARAALAVFREQGGGVLINVSSIVASTGQPFTSPYTISKWAIRGLSTALREELWGENIAVCTVLPASIDTPIFQHAANYSGHGVQALKPVVSAARVAKTIVRLAEHPKREAFVGMAGRLGAIQKVIMPAWYERRAARRVQQDQFLEAHVATTDGAVFTPMEGWTGVSGDWKIASAARPKRKGSGRGLKATAALAVPIAAAGLWLFRPAEAH